MESGVIFLFSLGFAALGGFLYKGTPDRWDGETWALVIVIAVLGFLMTGAS
jgi:hypothetical protein